MKFSPAVEAKAPEIVRLYEAGAGLLVVAEKVGLSHTTVSRVLRDRRVKVRRQGHHHNDSRPAPVRDPAKGVADESQCLGAHLVKYYAVKDGRSLFRFDAGSMEKAAEIAAGHDAEAVAAKDWKARRGGPLPAPTDPRTQAMVGAYERGATLKQIAAEFGVSTVAARARIRNHTIIRPRGRPRKQ